MAHTHPSTTQVLNSAKTKRAEFSEFLPLFTVLFTGPVLSTGALGVLESPASDVRAERQTSNLCRSVVLTIVDFC